MAVTAGIVAGLYRRREPEDGTVVAYAGPDSLSELADEVVDEANKLGVVLSPDIADQFWPDWGYPPDVRRAPKRRAVLLPILLPGLDGRARLPGRSAGALARTLEDFFVDHELAFGLDQDARLAAGRRHRRVEGAPEPLRPAVALFCEHLVRSRERAQQAWVRARFPATPREHLWLLPRPHKNTNGTNHLMPSLINTWMGSWVARIPRIDAGPFDGQGDPVPFDRDAIHPHAFRHTYAQTMADSGVAPSVLRDLMDHRSLSTTLGYYRVGEKRKRAAMEVLARHTVDNRGVTRPVEGEPSSVTHLREHLSWVAVPMGKCSEPTNVRAGGQACPSATSAQAAPTSSPTPPTCRSFAPTRMT